MNLEQFDESQQERIREHLNNYSTGKLVANELDFESMPAEILYISAETIKEAKGIRETAQLLGHFTEHIPIAYGPYDCTGQTFTTRYTLQRLDKNSFIAIHGFGVDV